MSGNDLWSVRAINKDDDTVIPETLGASVFSLSPETAWKGVKIRLCCKGEGRKWEEWVAEASHVFIHLKDDEGNSREHWKIKVGKVYDIKLVDDRLTFSVEGSFKKLASEGVGSGALGARSG